MSRKDGKPVRREAVGRRDAGRLGVWQSFRRAMSSQGRGSVAAIPAGGLASHERAAFLEQIRMIGDELEGMKVFRRAIRIFPCRWK